jgi:2'-5' RNA ligase
MDRTEPARGGDAHRLFFALWPDDTVRAALAAAIEGVDAFGREGRRTPASKYHLTLHYLGGWASMPQDVVERSAAAASGVECGGFHLVVDHAGHFGGARVGWLAPAGNSGLDALWSALAHALDEAGVGRRAAETFSPHVTVVRALRARVRDVPVDPISWPVDAFVLAHSHAGCYDIVGHWPLPMPA